MKTWVAVLLLALALSGCREVRVKSYATGETIVPGGNQITIVRSRQDLERLGVRALPVRFNHEFGVILIMGPHAESGWKQVIEDIRANEHRTRIVAFEHAPPDGGQPVPEYHTYTLWIVPNSVYRRGSVIDVVTPDGALVASTLLK
ncbi:MAG: hypothetical protein GIW95_10980 [Candidatus Eremiobacteraeota bacterium]|nr:hypothetical protein [Candidatus Eremiobacteraeota bacterium]